MPSREQLAFYALMPGADGTARLKLPTAFDLSDPQAWFSASILPRIQRRHERTLWHLTWKETPAGKTKVGEEQQGPPKKAGGQESPQGASCTRLARPSAQQKSARQLRTRL